MGIFGKVLGKWAKIDSFITLFEGPRWKWFWNSIWWIVGGACTMITFIWSWVENQPGHLLMVYGAVVFFCVSIGAAVAQKILASWGKPSQIKELSGDGLVIHSAFYGAKNDYRNVTDEIRKQASNGQIDISVSGDTCGCDPTPGLKKELWVFYTLKSKSIRVIRGSEHERLKITDSEAGENLSSIVSRDLVRASQSQILRKERVRVGDYFEEYWVDRKIRIHLTGIEQQPFDIQISPRETISEEWDVARANIEFGSAVLHRGDYIRRAYPSGYLIPRCRDEHHETWSVFTFWSGERGDSFLLFYVYVDHINKIDSTVDFVFTAVRS